MGDVLFVCVRVHNGTGFWRLNTNDDCDDCLVGWLAVVLLLAILFYAIYRIIQCTQESARLPAV